MTSGTVSEWRVLTRAMMFGMQDCLLLQRSSTSRSSRAFPSQKKNDRTPGTMFAQATRRSSTRAFAIRTASSSEPAVMNTITSSATTASLKFQGPQPRQFEREQVLDVPGLFDIGYPQTPALGLIERAVILLGRLIAL